MEFPFESSYLFIYFLSVSISCSSLIQKNFNEVALTSAMFASVSLHVLKNRLKIHLETELNGFQFRSVIFASKKFVLIVSLLCLIKLLMFSHTSITSIV